MENQESGKNEAVSHLKVDTLLRFRVGPFRFSVPAVEVEGIVVPPRLTVIPLNPPHSKGVFMYHQRLASAISLRSKFGLPDNDDANLGQLILGEVKTGLVGFWVDEVYETVDSTELEWRSMPEFVPHEAFESFAVKEDDIVMATTMQKLYDVPAEKMASMLASMRQNFDLPEDVPPVTAEGLASGVGIEDEDAFGDLVDSSRDDESKGEESARQETRPEEAPNISSSIAKDTRSTVVDFPGTQEVELASTQVNPSVNSTARISVSTGGAQLNSGDNRLNKTATASSTSSSASGTGISATYNAARSNTVNRGSANRGNDTGTRSYPGRDSSAYSNRHSSNQFSSRPNTVSGGTYAGSINRFQNENRFAEPGSGSSVGQDHDNEEKRSGSGTGWMLLALLLLVLPLIGYWLWPSANKDLTPVEQPGRTVTEAYSSSSPAPVTETTSAVSEPEPQAEQETPPTPAEEQPDNVAGTSGDRSNTDPSAQEVYRLEGKDVTVTVERNNPEQEATASEPSTQAVESGDNGAQAQPGYHEFVHVVVKGDTLWDIAKKYLKNPFRYPELARLSQIKNPDLIYPGDTVRIRTRDK